MCVYRFPSLPSPSPTVSVCVFCAAFFPFEGRSCRAHPAAPRAAAVSCRDPGLCLDFDRWLEVPAEQVRWAESEGGRDHRRNGRREAKAARTRFSLTRPRVAVPKLRDARVLQGSAPRRRRSCGRGEGDLRDTQVEKVVRRRRKVLGTQPCSAARTGGCAFFRVSHWTLICHGQRAEPMILNCARASFSGARSRAFVGVDVKTWILLCQESNVVSRPCGW